MVVSLITQDESVLSIITNHKVDQKNTTQDFLPCNSVVKTAGEQQPGTLTSSYKTTGVH